MSNESNLDKFDHIHSMFNNLMTSILSYVSPKLSSFSKEQIEFIKDFNEEINHYFSNFLLENNFEVLNINLLKFHLNNLSTIVNRLRYNDPMPNLDNYYKEIVDVQSKILNELNKSWESIELNKSKNLLTDNIKIVSEVKENIRNKDTHHVYDLAAIDNQKRSNFFLTFFLMQILLSLVFIWFISITKTYFGLREYDYWFFKIALILTSITLITYFLKQAIKYQKIADQCRQTKMELEAFPSFVASFTTEDPKIIEIRRELALKYFGRDLDSTIKDDTGGIVVEQMKSTTEMVKATTEVIKNLKVN
ncbi:hypothetical protein [Acinetobacter bereziniae]|uniref:hypothetical protein n=1 Tax=Acinetobacter bereziniae TaxID=106648 RepID=UPI00225693E9|nr:hypothetical protein [Acinetobacter bereziniae]